MIRAIRRSRSVKTMTPDGSQSGSPTRPRWQMKAGCEFARVGMSPMRRPPRPDAPARRKVPMCWRAEGCRCAGARKGADVHTSPVLVRSGRHGQPGVVGEEGDDTSTSSALNTSANRAARAASAPDRRSGAASGSSSARASDARARCKRPFAADGVASSIAATSPSGNPRTSFNMMTAVWRGGSTWSADTKASRTASWR